MQVTFLITLIVILQMRTFLAIRMMIVQQYYIMYQSVFITFVSIGEHINYV